MRLILLRHAKSEWGDPLQDDFDRPLNARGHASAAGIGQWLKAKGYVPDEILCSSACRARETWAGVAEELALDPFSASFHRDLYLASEAQILKTLRSATRETVLLVGHNPGIGYFAEAMADARPDHPKFLQYPTAATTVFQIDGATWADASPGTNPVLDFITPRDLPAV